MTRRLLLLTTVDPLARPNNREHHLLRHLGEEFDELVIVYRRLCGRRGTLGTIADALLPRARLKRHGKTTYVAVNPMLNHYEGMVRGAERRAGRASGAVFGAVGVLKDLSTILFLAGFALAQGRFDWCIALGPWGAAAARLLRRLGRISGFSYEDRDYEPGFVGSLLRKRWIERAERAGMRAADRVISIGERLAALRRRRGIAVDVVPTGVDLVPFSGIVRQHPAPHLVYAGNVAPWSGLDRVLRAAPAIRARHPDLLITIVGTGLPEYRAELERIVQELDLHRIVCWRGRLPHSEVPAILEAAGIGLAVFEPTPLRSFAAPLKLLEYMAAGLPTIGVADSETADTIYRHKVGAVCACDADAIASAVCEILADPVEYAAMSRRAVDSARLYRWDDLMSQELALVRASMERARPRGRPALAIR